MDRERIETIVGDKIAELTGCRPAAQDMRLREDCGMDSLSLVGLIVGAEEEFSVVFDDGDLDPSMLLTVENVVDLVERYL